MGQSLSSFDPALKDSYRKGKAESQVREAIRKIVQSHKRKPKK